MSYFICFLVAWFYCTAGHELAHAYFGWRRGVTRLKIVPYWHWYVSHRMEAPVKLGLPPFLGGKPPWPDAKFAFARYMWESPWAGPKPSAHEAIAPVYLDAITITLAAVSMFFVPWGYGAIFMTCAAIDAGNWFIGYLRDRPGSDGHSFRRRSF